MHFPQDKTQNGKIWSTSILRTIITSYHIVNEKINYEKRIIENNYKKKNKMFPIVITELTEYYSYLTVNIRIDENETGFKGSINTSTNPLMRVSNFNKKNTLENAWKLQDLIRLSVINSFLLIQDKKTRFKRKFSKLSQSPCTQILIYNRIRKAKNKPNRQNKRSEQHQRTILFHILLLSFSFITTFFKRQFMADSGQLWMFVRCIFKIWLG